MIAPVGAHRKTPRGRSSQSRSSAGACGGKNDEMGATTIIASLSALVTAAFVLGLFLWAARKDGEYDRETQRRLGIRRRTRL